MTVYILVPFSATKEVSYRSFDYGVVSGNGSVRGRCRGGARVEVVTLVPRRLGGAVVAAHAYLRLDLINNNHG